jgi:hemoglobin
MKDRELMDPELARTEVRRAIEERGGFAELADRFYGLVAEDSTLVPLYRKRSTLSRSARHMGWYMEEQWGGSPLYSLKRGQPRLVARHTPFPITAEIKDHWLALMIQALESMNVETKAESMLKAWLQNAAEALVNVRHRAHGLSSAISDGSVT